MPRPAPLPSSRSRSHLVLLAAALLAGCAGGEGTEQATDMAAPAMAGGAAAPPPPPVARSEAAKVAPGIARLQVQDARPAEAASATTAAGAAAAQPGAETVAPSMLIRTGAAAIEVRDLDRAMQQVTQLAASVGGFVANTSVQAGRDQVRSATLELRIPAARWDAAVRGLEPLGRVESVNVSAEDVGEEYTDLGARVANARRLEERLIGLLATRTGKLEDVLAVERELARVREEIERIEGRLRYLRTRAAVSTLSVTVHEPAPIVGDAGRNPIAEAVRQAWVNFVGFIAWFIAALGVLLPLALVLAALWWLLRRLGVVGPRRARPAAPLAPVDPPRS
jgi:hypothetical protein